MAVRAHSAGGRRRRRSISQERRRDRAGRGDASRRSGVRSGRPHARREAQGAFGDEEGVAKATAKAVAKARTLLEQRCVDFIVDGLPTCGDTIEELVAADGTTGCLRQSLLEAADDMTNAAYGAPPTTPDTRTCQRGIARAGLTYVTKALKAEQRCRNRVNDRPLYLDEDKTPSLSSSADCSNEWDAQHAIAKLGQKARAQISVSLGDWMGPPTSTAGPSPLLVYCEPSVAPVLSYRCPYRSGAPSTRVMNQRARWRVDLRAYSPFFDTAD